MSSILVTLPRPPKKWADEHGLAVGYYAGHYARQCDDNAARQAWAYYELMGKLPPEPLTFPDWTMKPKDWLLAFGPREKPTKRQAQLSPLELVAKARRDRDRAVKAFQSAVKSAVTAGESPSTVARSAGISRQRVYQVVA